MSSPEPVPYGNKPATLLGSIISIQIIAIIAVTFRIVARVRLAHGLKWDDYFVLLACFSAFLGTTFVCIQLNHGLGKHQWTLSNYQLTKILHYTYISLANYSLSTTFIKISLLLQFMRTADVELRTFRRTCLGLIAVLVVWGFGYFFAIIFSCNPVRGYWHPWDPSARCILFGSRTASVKLNAYIGHAASNMVLDIIIFLLPVMLIRSLNLNRRGKAGIAGLFVLGFTVVLISILRLHAIVSGQLGMQNPRKLDTTYHTPKVFIWTCLEVLVALICASIPIFWPMLSQMDFGKILVVNEVVVKSEPRRHRTPEWRSDDEQELTHVSEYPKIPLSRSSTPQQQRFR